MPDNNSLSRRNALARKTGATFYHEQSKLPDRESWLSVEKSLQDWIWDRPPCRILCYLIIINGYCVIRRVRGRKLYNYIVDHITLIPLIPRLGSLSCIQPSQPQFLQMPHPLLTPCQLIKFSIITFIHILMAILNKDDNIHKYRSSFAFCSLTDRPTDKIFVE